MRGRLAVDSVSATVRAGIKHVSRPRRPTQKKLPPSRQYGRSNGFVAEPAPSVANLRLPTFRIDLPGRHRVGGPRAFRRGRMSRTVALHTVAADNEFQDWHSEYEF